ncbi:hypothetical protein JB92DRAFT_2833577 [Gautieria morchelliformis]|nr:hypothetical protein JB92DRAFT_2833577 [Gautieria morchelliformis]
MSSQPSCRILTVSSTAADAKQLANKVVAASYANGTKGQSPVLLDDNNDLQWTISNKYYTASVHFLFAGTTEIRAQDAADVPACIFVFNPTKAFKDEFIAMMERVEDSDFEVSIAVSVPPPPLRSEETLKDFSGNMVLNMSMTALAVIQHMSTRIRRIIDALSTILWPSMVQKSGKRAKTRSMVSVPGLPGEEDGLRSLLNADKDPTESSTPLQREMAALEKWLEEGADDEKDPWVGTDLTQVNHSGASVVEDSRLSESGFDDNFSDFVSAPNPQDHLDTDGDPAFPSEDEVELISQRLREIGMSEDIDENDPQTPFDLSRILSTLDAMKEEIAGISDEDEKRKAAAKVALALVSGLGG